ncbi:hypothetical protein OIU79_022549 [Salix purpurea]|uniref:Uncharacterized protein n=1 Tax=Salix purpurea TaxID=77065 RepID=A0A9Q0WHQ9_SALPP|nr:hypothetical protein OIU79_022549 [Salix purpurea]
MGSAVLRSSLLPSFPQKPRFGDGKRPSGAVVAASRRENSREWMMGVDESMAVLRKRIHEMKMLVGFLQLLFDEYTAWFGSWDAIANVNECPSINGHDCPTACGGNIWSLLNRSWRLMGVWN